MRRKKPAKAPEPKRKAAAEGEDLTGAPCVHDYSRRYRGFMMCSNPVCGAICNMDGSALDKVQWRALIKQLRSEGLDL